MLGTCMMQVGQPLGRRWFLWRFLLVGKRVPLVRSCSGSCSSFVAVSSLFLLLLNWVVAGTCGWL
ncbi:hypothetical protein Ancab_040051 [Ancistrocladus abbreviatus]